MASWPDDVDTETKADSSILLKQEFNTRSDNREVFTAHFTVHLLLSVTSEHINEYRIAQHKNHFKD